MKTYWYDRFNGLVVPYDPAQHAPHAKKFLMWGSLGNGILLIGACDYHRPMHRETYFCAPTIVPHVSKNPSAAGDCSNGTITGWVSTGFRVRTPRQFFGPIADALGMEVAPEPKMEFID